MRLLLQQLHLAFALKDVNRDFDDDGTGAIDLHAAEPLVDGGRNLAGRHGLPTPLAQAAENPELILAFVDDSAVLVEVCGHVFSHDVQQRDAVAVGFAHGGSHVQRSGAGGT